MISVLKGPRVRLRETRAQDIPVLVNLRNKSRRFFFDRRKVNVALTRQWLEKSRKAGQYNWIVEVQGKSVGTISAVPRNGEGVEIGRMITHPEHRGKGYMQEALRLVTHFASARFEGPVFLEVKPDNPAAISLYRKSGYTITRLRMEHGGRKK